MENAKVLLLEDEPLIAQHISLELGERGYHVYQFDKAEAAFAFCKTQKIDLAVLNFFQKNAPPHLADGMAFAREFRKTCPGVRIVFLTGARQTDLRASPDFDARFSVLSKPFSRQQLRRLLLGFAER